MSDTPTTPENEASVTDDVVVQPVPLSGRQRVGQRISSLPALSWLPRLRVAWPRFALAAVVISVASLAVMLALLNSPLLEIETVDIEGADVISAASVKQLAGLKGEHVLLADLEAAERRIAALPMVKEVSIGRDWPNGVRVVIVERTPWGRWRANDTVWAFDSEGVILEGAAPAFNGPIVTQTSALPAIRAGAQIDLTAVAMVAELHKRGAPLPLPSVLAYEWSLTDGLVVVTEHGHIIFGDADGLDFKYAVWDLLEREAQGRGEPLILADLRFGLRPRVEIGLNVGRDIRIQDHTTASIPE